MASPIRTPAELQQPDRNGYSDTYEETRSRMPMEKGSARVRQKHRTSPRLFDVQWTFTQAKYEIFDQWFQDILGSGVREFDTQLLDKTETLRWFTCKWNPTTFTVSIDQHDKWIVKAKLWSNLPAFDDRIAGTDELIGVFKPSLVAHAMIRVGISLLGAAPMAMAARAVFSTPLIAVARFPNLGARGRISTPAKGKFEPILLAKGVLEVGNP